MFRRLLQLHFQAQLETLSLFALAFMTACHHSSARVRIQGEVVERDVLPSQIHTISEKYLNRPVQILARNKLFSTTYQEIGFKVDEATLRLQVEKLSKQGGLKEEIWRQIQGESAEIALGLALQLDVDKTTEFLLGIKAQVDALPTENHLDSAHDVMIPGEPGYLLQVLDSIVALKYEARRLSGGGKEQAFTLVGVEIPPTGGNLVANKDDFRVVLGWWETHYPNGSPQDSNRTGNLKLAAEKLDGRMIQPGETLSYNETVGERTERAGFKNAPEIGGGELADGVGGGNCQISSTLHAASFFAGLSVLETKPHSRPSSYIPVGLDSTVVYPTLGNPKGIDLKIKNPYPFPVMIRYSVGQGWVRAKILGRERPYDKVEFHREVLSLIPYSSTPIKRLDPAMPLGQVVVDQAGHVGYRVKRTRCFVRRGQTQAVCPEKDDKENTWVVVYSEVSTIVREGIGPLTLKPIRIPSAHYVTGIKDPHMPLVLSQ